MRRLLEHPNSERLRLNLLLLLLTITGFALRLQYLTTTHPFFDEYTTVLAARQALREGWPVLPSGLFYEHGLLATYLIVPFTALFINTPIAEWQPAHWGLMLARWPSLLAGTVTIPLLFRVGRRLVGPYPALLAAGLFAFSPEGIVWGGRARMYALATLLVLLVVYWAYQGSLQPAPAKYRWWALGALLLALLTQLGVLILIPPLLIGMGVIGWLSWKSVGQVANLPPAIGKLATCPTAATPAARPWFLRRGVLLEGVVLGVTVGLALLVKRLGQPLGDVPLGSAEARPPLNELVETVTYQTAFHLTWTDTVKFLARQFGVPHHFWLALAALLALGLIAWFYRARGRSFLSAAALQPLLFLGLIFGLALLEMVTLLEPFRRNPRYLVIALPLFYLLAAGLIDRVTPVRPALAITLALLAGFAAVGYQDVRLAFVTPEPAYEEAFAYVGREWQPGDTLLTMNTPAAGLYLDHADGFTVQYEAGQFLLEGTTGPVDRWLGVPWIGTMQAFNTALNESRRSWFVIDTIRQPVYFGGDWQAVVNSQMEQVWAGDDVLVYRTRPDRLPLPAQAETPVDATLGETIQLAGYTLEETQDQPLQLTLFWQALAPVATDYTVFLHLRDPAGATLAQWDGPPLDGAYPTSRWQPGQTIIDPKTLAVPPDLPPGSYTLFIGLYRLDTLERLPVAHDSSGENAILLAQVEVR